MFGESAIGVINTREKKAEREPTAPMFYGLPN